MWFKSYRDYEVDRPLIKYQVAPSHGIIGCEMHELFGWGNTTHVRLKRHGGVVNSRISMINEPARRRME
jgi:hypothetical protein